MPSVYGDRFDEIVLIVNYEWSRHWNATRNVSTIEQTKTTGIALPQTNIYMVWHKQVLINCILVLKRVTQLFKKIDI